MPAPTFKTDWTGELRSLKPDWDGYKASSITEEAIETLSEFSIVPCADGGLQLETHRDGFDIEIQIRPDGHIESALICLEPKP